MRNIAAYMLNKHSRRLSGDCQREMNPVALRPRCRVCVFICPNTMLTHPNTMLTHPHTMPTHPHTMLTHPHTMLTHPHTMLTHQHAMNFVGLS